MIKVKRVDMALFKGLSRDKPTDLQPIEDAVNEIGESRILHITCTLSAAPRAGVFFIFYHED